MNHGVNSADALEKFTEITESYFSKGIELLKLIGEINKQSTPKGYSAIKLSIKVIGRCSIFKERF